jgi:predicted secreted hydrolase
MTMPWTRVGPIIAIGLVAVAGCGETRSPDEAGLSLTATLGGADTVGYARAVEARPFVFPDDHGPHPEYRTEWWYATGNLSDANGRRVGYQFTIFRSALAPRAPESSSVWATNQAYMAHLAVTDAKIGEFRAFERFARGAGDLAGAQANPFRVWLEDWVLEGEGGDSTFPISLRASDGDVVLDLMLEAGKPLVLQGDSGLSLKGPEPGNASYYYSFTRMPTRGVVALGADTLTVSGASWLDREWSTSVLTEGQVGWDWFALQMDDGWELMVYALRMADGGAHPMSEGILVDPQGRSRRLAWGSDVQVAPLDTWISPQSGIRYPSGWRVRVPSRGWELEVDPVIADQELNLAFRYWEGAVTVRGAVEGAVQGKGYVELTGYGEGLLPKR